MNYKELYKDLAHTLTALGCSIFDYDYKGYCIHAVGMKALIVIKTHMSYKEKYFCLAHEAGHLFYMKKGKMFNWSKKARTEEEANRFAIQMIRLNEGEVQEYKSLYNKAVHNLKNRRKSWFEL